MKTKANPFSQIYGICQCGQLTDRYGESVDSVPDDSPGILRPQECRKCRREVVSQPLRNVNGFTIAAVVVVLVALHLGLLLLINL